MRRTRPRNTSGRSSSRPRKATVVAKIRRTSVEAYGTRSEWSVLSKACKQRDGHKCRKCGDTEYLQVDHIILVSRGGLTTLSNLWTLCDVCHSKRPGHQKAARLITHKRRKDKQK
jgi:5-methylcytosine-specific restriction endonuclease McrA